MLVFLGMMLSMVILLLWYIILSMLLNVCGLLFIFRFMLKFWMCRFFIMLCSDWLVMFIMWVVFMLVVSFRW